MNTYHHDPDGCETALTSGYRIRDLARTDYPAVLVLNSTFERFLSPMNDTRLVELHQHAAYARVVLHPSCVVAFLLAFRERAIYDGPNYVWFDQYYPNFLYIDRIVVSADHQGKRLGSALYTDLFRYATEARIPRVTCQFDAEPPPTRPAVDFLPTMTFKRSARSGWPTARRRFPCRRRLSFNDRHAKPDAANPAMALWFHTFISGAGSLVRHVRPLSHHKQKGNTR